MKLYKVLLAASILGSISMPARMADLYANVDLGTDNTITANTSTNIAIGNMNTTDRAMAVGSNNTAKNDSIIVGRDNSGNDSHIIVGANNTATTPRYRQAIGTGNFIFGVHNNVEGDGSIVIGRANTAISENPHQPNTIIGNSSSAEGNGIVIGSSSMATSGNIAIGNYVRAIGTPDVVDPNNEFKFLKSDAKRGATSLVSFGGRQLKTIAPGAMTETSTDAVNGPNYIV